MKTIAPSRTVRCRMLNRFDDQCTAEALDPEGDVLICARHAGRVLELINTRAATSTSATGNAYFPTGK